LSESRFPGEVGVSTSAEGQTGSPERALLLSILVVNYENWEDVGPLVRRLLASPAIQAGAAEIVVVDNASTQPPPPTLLTPMRGLRLILSRENGGFSAGVNLGWRASRGRWVLLLNPDVVAESNLPDQVLARIAAYEARADGPPGIVGFGLRNEDGTRQPSVGAEPGLLQSLGGLFLPRDRRKYQPERRLCPGAAVPWVTGACALVDSRVLDALNGMDEDFFLYYEEVALCRSARALGRRVEYDPAVEVVHLRPLQNRGISPRMRVIVRHSKLLFFRKFQPAWEFQTLCLLVTVEAKARGAWALLRGDRQSRRAWSAVSRLVRDVRTRGTLRGTRVRDLASSVNAEPGDDEEAAPTSWECPRPAVPSGRGNTTTIRRP
jgi:N-acetylglucosaminyl-diphospho-decaprenol L-rhamnosyltransferase